MQVEPVPAKVWMPPHPRLDDEVSRWGVARSGRPAALHHQSRTVFGTLRDTNRDRLAIACAAVARRNPDGDLGSADSLGKIQLDDGDDVFAAGRPAPETAAPEQVSEITEIVDLFRKWAAGGAAAILPGAV